jgi:hypothetical protein
MIVQSSGLILRTTGQIKEEQNDARNITKLSTEPPIDYDKLDELVLWRQRTVFISNDVTVQRSHDDYNERKASHRL